MAAGLRARENEANEIEGAGERAGSPEKDPGGSTGDGWRPALLGLKMSRHGLRPSRSVSLSMAIGGRRGVGPGAWDRKITVWFSNGIGG